MLNFICLGVGVPLTTFGSPPYGVRFAPCFAPLRALQAAHAKPQLQQAKLQFFLKLLETTFKLYYSPFFGQ